ncbi:hypothetical protein SLEP1_g13981 [Rubroshorea leprosula]|uniref:Uncharacterized protein n=1 Tax=Rubroshorea leprosula TaxID=152421 RepID=A0AAV5IQJ9_9ROSI|nr:hypothetical protein SLEP1_g13981 [Rubroshorea leprosula]
MLNMNVGIDNNTFPVLIQASAERLSVFEEKQVHDHVLKMGFDLDVYVGNTLINVYSVCGSGLDACKLFDESPALDIGRLFSGWGRRESEVFVCQDAGKEHYCFQFDDCVVC